MRLPTMVTLFSRSRRVAAGHTWKRHRVMALRRGWSCSIHIKALDCVGPRRLWVSLPPTWPGCEDPGPLGPLPLAHPVLWARLRGRLLRSGVVSVLHLSQGSQPINACIARETLGPHGKFTARCPRWGVTRPHPHATSPRVSNRKVRRRVSVPGSSIWFTAAPLLPRVLFFALLSSSTTRSRSSGSRFSATLAVSPLSARSAPSIPPLRPVPSRPANEGGALTPGLGLRPLLVSAPCPEMAACAPLPDPLGWLGLLLATDLPSPSPLDVDAATPGVAEAVTGLVRGVLR